MTKHNLFSNVLATNGLARGYGPRPHKRKRKGLRFALVVLLIAVPVAVYVYQTDQIPQLPVSIEQLTKPVESCPPKLPSNACEQLD